MKRPLQRLAALRRAADRQAAPLLAVGLVGVAAYNALKWREDHDLALGLREERARPRPPLTATPRVSILVAAWNEAELIDRHIASVLALSYPDREYILCAGGADGTYALAKRHEQPGLTVLEQHPAEGKQAALRRCLERATGEVIYLTDADCLLDDDSFERTLAPVVEGEVEAATGGARPLVGSSSWLSTLQYGREVFLAARARRESPGLQGCNCAIRRSALLGSGGFETDAPTGTDYRLARSLIAAGHTIRRVRSSEVASAYPVGPRAYARQQARWLRNLYVHGSATHDWAQAGAALGASLAGLLLLGGPMLPLLLGRSAAAAVLCLDLGVLLARVRQFALARTAGCIAKPGPILWSPLWVALDTLVWVSVPVQLLSADGRRRW